MSGAKYLQLELDTFCSSQTINTGAGGGRQYTCSHVSGTNNLKLVLDTFCSMVVKWLARRRWGGGKRGGGVLDRRDVLDIMHGRSRMTIDPRIPTMPGRSMSGFHRPGRHCLHQARSAVRCPASCMKGEPHPTKNCLWKGVGGVYSISCMAVVVFTIDRPSHPYYAGTEHV